MLQPPQKRNTGDKITSDKNHGPQVRKFGAGLRNHKEAGKVGIIVSEAREVGGDTIMRHLEFIVGVRDVKHRRFQESQLIYLADFPQYLVDCMCGGGKVKLGFLRRGCSRTGF